LEGSEIAAILPGFEPAATDGRAAGPPSGESAPVTLLTVHRADGTAIRVEVRVATVQLGSETCALASVTDVSERIAALEDAQRSLREKEVLLKEIHHRVKNNLQIVSSLLRLKCDHLDAPEVRAPLEDSISRVRSMAMVHEHLYGNASLEQIDLGDYARHLTGILRSAYAPSAGLEVLAEPILVSIELATPIGLILNELVSNAFKHGVARAAVRAAAGEFQREDVRVEVRVEAARICIVVHDAGPGMPPGQDERSTGTLGLQLVGVLCQQLEGSIHFHNDEGLRAQFSCPFPGSG
jgi:two-component sensor histidine kinase